MNNENRLPVVEIQGVHAYIDELGAAWLNAEDIARGLGFVQVKKDRVPTSGDKSNLLNTNKTINDDNYYTVVRWERVNEYLREFGYPTEVGKGDYIPESMVYMLAMKANNETARNFQRLIAFEILPSLRKYGYYALPRQNKQNYLELNDATVKKFLRILDAVENYKRAAYDYEAKQERIHELQEELLRLENECKVLLDKKQELIAEIDSSLKNFFL